MTDDLKERLRANHLDECYEAIDRIEALTAERDALKAKLALRTGEADAKALIIKELESEVKEAQIDAIRAALEAAAKCCDDKADRCDAAIKWGGGSARHNQDCIAAAYAMRDRASAIRAIDPAAIAANLKGDWNEK